MYHSVGPNSSHRKFRSPSPTFKICPSPFPFILVPQPSFYSRPAKLFLAWIMVCSCSRTIREVFFSFPTPIHASLSFSFHSPHIILLLQAAFPKELTLTLPWSVALVDLGSGECHQATVIVRCQGEKTVSSPRAGPLDQTFQANVKLNVPGFSARLGCSWESYYLILTNRKIKLVLKKPSGKSSVTSCKYLLQNDLSVPLGRTYPPLGLPTFTLFLTGNAASHLGTTSSSNLGENLALLKN